MKEAKVTCLCAQMRLPDLEVVLTENQVIWLSQEKAHLSENLKHARRIGAVKLEWKERARVTKSPAPPFVRRLVPGQHRKPVREETPQQPVVVQSIDPDALAKQVKAAVAGEVSKHMAGVKTQMDSLKEDLLARITEALAGQGQQMDLAMLAKMLEETLRSVTSQPTQAAATASAPDKPEGEEPLYIPSGIVEENLKGYVEVQEDTDEDSDLDDALKAFKKRKRNEDEQGS